VLRTRFTDLVGCDVPIQQAGMGSLAAPPLAQAVADAGGLGTVSVFEIPARMVADVLDNLAERTPGAFGGNIILRFIDPDRRRDIVAATAARARVVDFFYSDPDPELIEIVHNHSALACWQVGSRDEAVAAVEAGCDFIIAQGIEAGGHIRGQSGLLALLDEVLDAVDVPVLAAGGIGSGRALAAVLAAGADGARVGTRFIAAEEAGAHPDYVSALIAARPMDTVYTEAFRVGWPEEEAPHRVLRSSLDAARSHDGPIVGEGVSFYTGVAYPIERFGCDTARAEYQGEIAAMSLWAGESVGGITRVQPAADIIREIVDEAEQLLRRW
jgi:NAD(P)H-dependent flavin oxidoreductase YrpB (nitropropane dioxygenase family)